MNLNLNIQEVDRKKIGNPRRWKYSTHGILKNGWIYRFKSYDRIQDEQITDNVNHIVKSLLFNQDYSNLYFIFDDGTRIPGHKNIIYTRSEYFR